MQEIKRAISYGHQDVTSATVNGVQVNNITPLITQSTEKYSRIGNKIKTKFLTIDTWTEYNSNDNTTDTIPIPIRVAIFTSRINPPLVASDWLEQGAFPATNDTIFVPLRSESLNVLKDKKTIIANRQGFGPGLAGAWFSAVPSAFKSRYHKRFHRSITYKISGETDSEIPKNNLYLMTQCIPQALTTVTTHFAVRLSFYDL